MWIDWPRRRYEKERHKRYNQNGAIVAYSEEFQDEYGISWIEVNYISPSRRKTFTLWSSINFLLFPIPSPLPLTHTMLHHLLVKSWLLSKIIIMFNIHTPPFHIGKGFLSLPGSYGTLDCWKPRCSVTSSEALYQNLLLYLYHHMA